VLLKKVVSWLKRGQKVPFLREICPLKKMTPKYNAASGIIAGELLNESTFRYIIFDQADCTGLTINYRRMMEVLVANIKYTVD
jgi:hypothetical protein